MVRNKGLFQSIFLKDSQDPKTEIALEGRHSASLEFYVGSLHSVLNHKYDALIRNSIGQDGDEIFEFFQKKSEKKYFSL